MSEEQILEELWKNSRIQIKELATKIPLSRQTISKIKNQLWQEDIIQTPTILINPHSVNMQILFMEIKTNPSEPKVLQAIKNLSQISRIDGILGNYSLMVRFEVTTKLDFAEILNNFDLEVAGESKFHAYRIIETLDVYKMGGFILERPQNLINLSEKHWQLLHILKKNNNPKKWPILENKEEKLDKAELKFIEGLNLSREISNLQENHVIQRFTIKLGQSENFKLKFYLRIKPKNIREYTDLANQLAKNPYIIDLYRTGEESGLLAIIRTNSLDEYNLFIQNLYKNYNIADTHTTVVVNEIIPSIFPPTLRVAEEVINNS